MRPHTSPRLGRLVPLALVAALLFAFSPLAARPAAAAPLGAISAATPVAATAGNGPRLLIAFRADADAASRARALRAVGGVVVGTIAGLGVTRVALTGDSADAWSDLPAVVALLANDPAVSSVEQDATVHLALTPNDTYYLNDPLTPGLGQWGARKIQADRAWDVQRGLPSVIVAVIDTGIDPTHPDLVGSLVPGATFVSEPSSACTPSTRDDNTHGTHVAGIIGAAGNNGQGVAGVAFGVRLLAIKALDCTGTGTVGDIAQAIIYAVNNGARIINVSLGSPQNSPTIRAAVQAAAGRNVLIVAAAGNCGIAGGTCDVANEISYPAAYPEVLAVAATDVDDTRAPFSTQASYVGVAAPGRRIISTSPTYPTYLSRNAGAPTSGYAVISGTSQATPFVAGTAALVLSREPNLPLVDLIARLKNTADHLGTPGTNAQFGAGRINAFAALTAFVQPVTPTVPTYGATYDLAAVPRSAAFGVSSPMTVKLTNTSNFAWTVGGASPVRLAYHWSDPTGQTVFWDGVRTPFAADVPVGGSATVVANVTAPVTPGLYTLRFDLVREGVSWFSGQGVATGNVSMTVNTGFGASYVVGGTVSANLALGIPGTLAVTLANTGTRVWPAAGPTPVRLSYHWLRADGSVAVWEGLRASFPTDVPGGASTPVSLSILPPSAVGTYMLRLDLVQEGISWFSDQGVIARDLPYNVNSGLAPTWTPPGAVPTLLPGGRASIPVTVRNDGAGPWAAAGVAPVRIAPHIVDVLGNVVLWDGPRTLLTADVPVGGSFTGTVSIPAPLVAGTYRVRIDLVQEGVSWFSTQGAATAETSLVVVADFRATLGASLAAVSRTSPIVAVAVANTSSALWAVDGQAPVALAAHWYDAAGNVLVWDGPRTKLSASLAAGAMTTVNVNLGPPPPGAALVSIDLVADGLRWFGVGTPRPVTFIP